MLPKNFEKLLKLKNLRPATIDKYIQYIENTKLTKFEPEDINKWIVNTSCAISTKYAVSCAMKTYYKKLGETEKANKLIAISWISKPKQIDIGIKGMQRMIDVCNDNELKLYMMFLRDTGLRRGILESLTPNMIDRNIGEVLIKENIFGNKGKMLFNCWISKETLEFLNNYIKINNITMNQKIFRFKWVKNRSDINYQFLKLAKKAKLSNAEKVSPHVFRHSFASAWIAKGGSIEGLRYVLGHKTMNTTLRYSHRDKERAMSDINKLRNIKNEENK